MDKWVWYKDDPTKWGPGIGSWFHIMFIFITITSIFCFTYFLARKHDRKLEKYITLGFAIFLLILEILRQTLFCQAYGFLVLKYFPFDLCSMPMYFTFVSFFINNENNRIKKGCDMFNVLFGFIGGFGITIYPKTVLDTPFVYRSLQTMLYHGALATYAIYLFVSKKMYLKSVKEVVPAVLVLIASTSVAVILNEALYPALEATLKSHYVDATHYDEWNLFFLSSHYPEHHNYPLLEKITIFPLYILAFMVSVSGIAFLVFYLMKSPYFIYNKYFKKPEIIEL